MVRISNKELLDIIENNARLSFVDIARKLNITEAAVRKKISKLQEKGIIKGYTTEIDYRKLGYKLNTLTGIDTEPDKYIYVIEQLKAMKDIKKLYTSTGDHMIMFETWFKDSEELTNFIKRIESMDGVTKVCPAIILERVK